jgi:hypothetical protein
LEKNDGGGAAAGAADWTTLKAKAQQQRAIRQQARILKRAASTVEACTALLARLEQEILAEAELIVSVSFLFGATSVSPKERKMSELSLLLSSFCSN